jgi:hypothetical protein
MTALSHRQDLGINKPQNEGVQEYTDAALKYIHSFLPHQTLLTIEKAKKIRSYHTLESGLRNSEEGREKHDKNL